MEYFLNSGGKWSGDILVLDFAQYESMPSPSYDCHLHRIKEVKAITPWVLPAKNAKHGVGSEARWARDSEGQEAENEENPAVAHEPRDEDMEALGIAHDPRSDFPRSAQGSPQGSGGNSGEDSESSEKLQDSWVIRGEYIVRLRVVPRKALFAPYDAEDPPPLPLKDLDVARIPRPIRSSRTRRSSRMFGAMGHENYETSEHLSGNLGSHESGHPDPIAS